MTQIYDLVVIGGGPAGIIAAIAAGRIIADRASIMIIEKEKRLGRKLMATGNGRCNLTNMQADSDSYFGQEPWFARGALHRFSTAALLSFFHELGLKTRTDFAGRVYPYSNQASSVLDVLRLELHRLEIKVKTEEKVINIVANEALYIGEKPLDQKLSYNILTETGLTFKARSIIVATGGLAAPSLGADGSGYKLLELLGHHLVKPVPALAPLTLADPICKKLSGIRFDASGSVYAQQELLCQAQGEFLWTDYGISGIAAMELARTVAQSEQDIQLELDFLPDMTLDELNLWLQKRKTDHPDLVVGSILTGLLQRRLGEELVKKGLSNSVLPALTTARLKQERLEELALSLKKCRLHISGTRSWEQAQVTAGGIAVRDFYPDSMKSRLADGIFAAGEVLDIDAACGGYNLQWAWSSGWLAGFKAAGQLFRQGEKG